MSVAPVITVPSCAHYQAIEGLPGALLYWLLLPFSPEEAEEQNDPMSTALRLLHATRSPPAWAEATLEFPFPQLGGIALLQQP